jgi:hypothetical protein
MHRCGAVMPPPSHAPIKEESMKKEEFKSEPVVVLTVVQAKVALECIDNDIGHSDHGDKPNYTDVSELMFYLQRAEVRQRLFTAIRAAESNL